MVRRYAPGAVELAIHTYYEYGNYQPHESDANNSPQKPLVKFSGREAEMDSCGADFRERDSGQKEGVTCGQGLERKKDISSSFLSFETQ